MFLLAVFALWVGTLPKFLLNLKSTLLNHLNPVLNSIGPCTDIRRGVVEQLY